MTTVLMTRHLYRKPLKLQGNVGETASCHQCWLS